MKCGIFCVLLLTLSTVSVLAKMELRHRWKSPDFTFPNRATKRKLTANRSYVKNTGFMLDVDRDRTGRMFVTTPPFENGTKVTLATISGRRKVDSPLLKPYPSWSWHQGSCDGLTSVFRIKIDACNRLWALDSGVVDVFGTHNRICPPRLLVFDLNTDKLIKKYIFPKNVLAEDTLLVTVEVDTDDRCRNTFAYVADVTTYKLIVYNLDNDRSWLVNSSAFYPNHNFSKFNIDGSEFELMDGLFALTLSPKLKEGDRVLFFHSLASNCESAVRTSVLNNARNFANGPNLRDDQIQQCFGTRQAQSAAEAMDSRGNLFSSNLAQNAIDVWNWNKRFNEHTVVKRNEFFQFISGMKVVRGRGYHGEDICAISCRFQKIMTTGLNRDEYNFHIVCGSAVMLARSRMQAIQ